jgi:hypothetical protein
MAVKVKAQFQPPMALAPERLVGARLVSNKVGVLRVELGLIDNDKRCAVVIVGKLANVHCPKLLVRLDACAPKEAKFRRKMIPDR